MDTATHVSYDQVPYNSSAFRLTHPSHLATIATLFGMAPPVVRRCRVLELGCASGGNLIPMAQDLPESTFLGVDLSAQQIADGQAQLEQLPLTNIQLRHQSILDVDPSWGVFDYIICHGVYSWVPEAVRQKILRIGRDNLQPQGVLYVSYNTYPGWHMRGVVRDMMRYHVADIADPRTKIAQARALLTFLTQLAGGRSEAYRQVLKDESEIVDAHADSYLFHEHLEEENDPLYFYQFVEAAEASGLQYLGETEFTTMLVENMGSEAAAILQGASLIQQEQYMDFLRNRMFRATLLCHQEQILDRNVDPARLLSMHVALESQPELPHYDPCGSEAVSWQGPHGETLTVAAPITKAAILLLDQAWPNPIPFQVLLERARAALYAGENQVAALQHCAQLAEDLMTLFSRMLLRVQVDPPEFTLQPGERPEATPLARGQAEQGEFVTTRRHEQVQLPDLARRVLSFCDGQHDRKQLAKMIEAQARSGEIVVHRGDERLTQVDATTADEIVHGTLDMLARNALLLK